MVFFLDCLSNLILFFFFFQAEDGIRDDLVTGVQTCALPAELTTPYICAFNFEPLLAFLVQARSRVKFFNSMNLYCSGQVFSDRLSGTFSGLWVSKATDDRSSAVECKVPRCKSQ